MGTILEPGTVPMVDLRVPEFFMTNIGHSEPAGSGLIRFYCCLHDAGVMIPQFIATLPVMRVPACAKLATQMSAQVWNDHALSGRLRC